MWIKRLPKIEIRKVSAAAIAAGMGAAIGYTLIPWWWIFPVIIFAIMLPPRRIIPFTVWFALCLSSGMIHKYFDDAAQASQPTESKRISGEIICIDRRTTAVDSLENPTVLTCKINTGKEKFEAAVIFPRGHARVLYGQRFNFKGRYYPAKSAGINFDGNTFQDKYPPVFGNRPLILADETEIQTPSPKFFRPFFYCRDAMLKRLLAGIDDPEIAALAAKMFFNASTGVPSRLRSSFVNSGTFHLFSVSGLHVTIIAGLLLLLLRPLSFVWRYRITALAIVFYVLCTGAPVPAIRAGAMIVIWCWMRSMLFYAPGWNAMMLTWCAFALLSPTTLASLGAQYSFGITAALILLLEKLKSWREADREILELMPSNQPLTEQTRRQIRFKHRVISTILVAIIAFAASSGLSVLRQNLFIPGSILTNLLITLLTPLLFICFIIKLLVGIFLPFLNGFSACVFQAGFYALTDTVTSFAAYFPPIPTLSPPIWSIIIFYLLLFTALSCNKSWLRMLCIFAIIAIMVIWPWSKINSPAKIMIINHGANNPALLAYMPAGGNTAYIVDVPDTATGRLAAEKLRENGFFNVQVNFSRGVKNHSNGVQALAQKLHCNTYPPGGKRKPTKAFLRNLNHPLIHHHHQSGNGFAPSMDKDGSVEWIISGNLKIKTEITDSGRMVTIIHNSDTTTVTIPWCSLPTVWEISLPQK